MTADPNNHNARRKKLEVSDRKKQLDFIYRRDGAICQLCLQHVDRADASRDHIKRLVDCTKKEARDLNNMRLAHKACNEQRREYDMDVVPLIVINKNGNRRLSIKIGNLFPELQDMFHGSDE